MRRLVLVLGALAALPAAVPAQSPWLRPGLRVRVTSADVTSPVVTGEIGAVGADSLVLLRRIGARDTLRMAVPMAGITRLEVSQGRHSRWQTGLAIGLGAGALTGAIIGASSGSDLLFTSTANAFIGAVVFTPIGGTIGLVAGALTKHEDWETVPLGRPMVALRPGPGGRLNLGLRIPIGR